MRSALALLCAWMMPGLAHAGWMLPAEAGEQLARCVDRGDIADVLPQGWHLMSADIEKDRIRLRLDAGGRQLEVLLRAAGRGEEADYRGRHFQAQVKGLGQDIEVLRAAISRVDGCFERSPWVQLQRCSSAVSSIGPQSTDTSCVGAPAWVFVGLGFSQWLALLAVLAMAIVWGLGVEEARSGR
ncbi:MAG: hypothetical protein JXR96_14980 [Deltaproteobacteria bacterium]|nr:hypothetical protein [Deltaproteobacteria bacterium]